MYLYKPKNNILLYVAIILFFSCSHKKQLVYLNNTKIGELNKLNFNVNSNIEIGDVLKIDVITFIPEVSIPYNNLNQTSSVANINLSILEGYRVEKDSTISYPFLGKINVVGFSTDEFATNLKSILITNGIFTNPFVKVNIVNSKFTVLGEVQSPGTFYNYENQLNIFQSIGFAGDLLITANRKNIKLIRQENGLRKTYEFTLNNKEIFDKPYYYIKNNDIIIIEPNYSKIKSAGFIGSPSSIASISSLLLSVTLLLINR